MRVRTSPGVVSVTASAMGHPVPLYAVKPGEFDRATHVPGLPFFLLGRSYPVQIVAATADGRSTTFSLSVRVER